MKKSALLLLLLCININLFATEKPNPESYGKNKPFLFMENKGQVMNDKGRPEPGILFTAKGKGVNLYFQNDGIIYQFIKTVYPENSASEKSKSKFNSELERKIKTVSVTMKMQLVGANPSPQIVKENKSEYFENYYLPHFNNGAGITNVGGYTKVTYKNIYPNIDWIVYSNKQKMKYDFVVHPGGNPADIKMNYKQPKSVEKNEDGSVSINSLFGKVTEEKPFTYQAVVEPAETNVPSTSSGNQEVASSFTNTDNTLSFAIGSYNKQQDLIIDPGIIWGSYFGGAGDDEAYACVVSNGGEIYITGKSNSPVFTGDSLTYGQQSSIAVFDDAFTAKFDANSNPLWTTYYGGNGLDYSKDIQLDAIHPGSVYIVGNTSSSDLYLSNAFQTNLDGGQDGFIAQINSTGFITKASYFGGNGWFESIESIALDLSGDFYITGYTNSTSGISSTGAAHTSISGSLDAFYSKFDSTWTLQYSSYLGGVGDEKAWSILLLNNGTAVLAGETSSINGLDTNAVGQGATFGGGVSDAFIAIIDITQGTINQASYIGGAGDDYAYSVSFLGLNDEFIVGGQTNSLSGIGLNPSGLQVEQLNFGGGGNDGFLIKMNNFGIIAGTYIGGGNNENVSSVFCDGNRIYAVGKTQSLTGISTSNAFQSVKSGSREGFIEMYDANFNRSFFWGTYYGGPADDILNDVYVNPATPHRIYVCGASISTSNVAFNDGIIDSNQGSYDAILAVFSTDCANSPNPLDIISSSGSLDICSGSSITLNATGGFTYVWNGTTSGNSITVSTQGNYTVESSIYGCTFSKTVTVNVNPLPSVTVSPSGVQYICQGDNITLNTSSGTAISFQWYLNNVAITGETNSSLVADQGASYTVEVFNGFGCSVTSNPPVTIVVNSPPNATITSTVTSICVGSAATLTANNAAVSYQWYYNNSVISGAISSTYNATQSGSYYVKETSPNFCSSNSNSITITVIPYPTTTINYTGEPYICPGIGNTITLQANTGTGLTYQWQLNGNNISGATNATYTANASGSYTVEVTNAGLCSTVSTPVVINPTPTPTPICVCTVDNSSTYNLIVWEKPITTTIDSFRVYREDISNVYTYVASVDYDSLSQYTDIDIANADPNTNTKRYKLKTVSICGDTSAFSDYHNTIRLNDQGTGTFDWNLYDIQNSTTPVSQYILYRDTTLNNLWYQIQSTAGTQTSMVAPNYLTYPNCRYRIESNFGFACDPTRAVNVTRSNIKNHGTIGPVMLSEKSMSSVMLFPNPAEKSVTLICEIANLQIIQFMDMRGNLIQTISAQQYETSKGIIDLSTYAKGVYFVQVMSNRKVETRKLVVQ